MSDHLNLRSLFTEGKTAVAENITRCPKCNTSFRISDAHLSSAKGAVRCGSCLHIFNARENLISEYEEDLHQESNTPPEPEVHFEAPNHHNDFQEDEELISDDMGKETNDEPADELSEEFSDSMFGKTDTGEFEFNLFERDANPEEEDDVVPEDESWALDLLENDDEEESPTETPTESEIEQQEELAREKEFEESYFTNSFQIVGDEETPQQETSANLARDIFENYDESDVEEYDYSDTGQTYETSSSNSNQYLDSIEPEPVEFDWHTHSNLWHSKALWGSLSLIAGVLFVGQLAWMRFDTLSTIEPYRGYYAIACDYFACELPDLVDRSKIRTANLVVRTHPKAKDALIVDAVLQNTAKFEQTFPILDLVFTDYQDKAVAARRLTPKDYLGGELAGRTHMPVRQPIHIAIEIADPGKQAIGYKLSIAN